MVYITKKIKAYQNSLQITTGNQLVSSLLEVSEKLQATTLKQT